MRRSTTHLVALGIAIGLVACGFNPSGQPSGGNMGAGNQVITGFGGAGAQITGGGGSGSHANPDSNCGSVPMVVNKLPPEILIVLDRSGSMNEAADAVASPMCAMACGAMSRWAAVVPAINQVTMETQADVSWGLKFFANAGNGQCSVNNTASVAPGLNTSAMIATAIMGETAADMGVSNGSRTPTRAAIQNGAAYLRGRNTANRKFIMLATDGLPNCPAAGGNTATDDSPAAIQAVTDAAAMGVSTFVVGVATAGTTGDTTLSSMATAGGFARQGVSPAYYPVSSTADLAAALRLLVDIAASCTYPIPAPPTNNGTTSQEFIVVYINGQPVVRGTDWDYTDAAHNSITLKGAHCDQVLAGTVTDVQIFFECLVP